MAEWNLAIDAAVAAVAKGRMLPGDGMAVIAGVLEGRPEYAAGDPDLLYLVGEMRDSSRESLSLDWFQELFDAMCDWVVTNYGIVGPIGRGRL